MQRKKCEHCGEIIHINSKKCAFCEGILSENPTCIIEDSSIVVPEGNQSYREMIRGSRISHIEVQKEETTEETTTVPEKISNGTKVFLTAFVCIVPGLGQIIGFLVSAFLLSNAIDDDSKSFGRALLVTTMFVTGMLFLCFVMYGSLLTGITMSQ